MTDEIRAELRAELGRQGISMTELAREIGSGRNHVSRLLSPKRENVGDVSKIWTRILYRLGYKLSLEKIEA